MSNNIVYSLGHSNIKLREFIKILKDLDIDVVLDVRSNPKSSYVPYFDKENLQKELSKKDIKYTYCGKELGGRQEKDYPEYTKDKEYQKAIKHCQRIIDNQVAAIMCSEKDHRKCHRKYICKTLISNGYKVKQIDVNQNDLRTQQNMLNIEE